MVIAILTPRILLLVLKTHFLLLTAPQMEESICSFPWTTLYMMDLICSKYDGETFRNDGG